MKTQQVTYTPGPWIYEESTKTIRSSPSNYWLASIDSWDGAVDHEANARLIAAAPELLEALERTQKCFDCKSVNGAWTNEDRAVYAHNGAAIRKARGE